LPRKPGKKIVESATDQSEETPPSKSEKEDLAADEVYNRIAVLEQRPVSSMATSKSPTCGRVKIPHPGDSRTIAY